MAGVTQCRDAQPEQVFSDISSVDMDKEFGQSDAEELLDSLADAYDNAFSGSTELWCRFDS